MCNANNQKDSSRGFKVMLGALTLLVIASLSVVSVIALNSSSTVISNTVILSTSKITVSTPVTASGIQVAVNAVIAAGGGTVYIPSGDWVINQTVGGAISIDLETLPSGAWLNIIGSYTNVTTTQQNGQSITCPATILRSYKVNDGSLPAEISTFNIIGSATAVPSNLNYVNSANRHIRISGLTILGDVTNDAGSNNDGLDISCVDGYLIDHCFIDSSVGADILTYASKGVISQCTISQAYHVALGELSGWGYGIEVSGNWNLWNAGFGQADWIMNLSQVIGLYNWQGINITYSNPETGSYSATGWTTNIPFTAGPVYIETSYFYYCRHGVTSNEYGYYVARYDTFYGGTDNSQLDIHGGTTGNPGGRGFEAYDDTFIAGSGSRIGSYGPVPRGGAGVIYNNTFENIPTAIELGDDGYSAHPSITNDPEYVNDMWIWSNTFIHVTRTFLVVYPAVCVGGVNYFTDSMGGTVTPTSPAPPRPGYVPYTYPHPLTLIGS